MIGITTGGHGGGEAGNGGGEAGHGGGEACRIWLWTAAVDGRKGFDTLCGIIQQTLGHDPLCGDLFVFRNRSAARIKILFWDGNGLVLYAKRLERGTFRWPAAGESTITLSSTQLMELLAGR